MVKVLRVRRRTNCFFWAKNLILKCNDVLLEHAVVKRELLLGSLSGLAMTLAASAVDSSNPTYQSDAIKANDWLIVGEPTDSFTPGEGSLSVGAGTALGLGSLAVGYGSSASGFYSFASGYWARADGWNSTAVSGGYASGNSAFAAAAFAYGGSSFAAAGGAAHGEQSFAANSGEANGYNSFAMGPGVKSYGYGTIVLGRCNAVGSANGSQDPLADHPDGHLFVIGNGTADYARSNALVVLHNGTVQIPSGNLQLGGENALTSTSATTLISNHLSTNGYLKKAYGTGAIVSNGGIAAFGNNTQATEAGAFAVGNGAHASGSYSVALNGIAEGASSLALGGFASGENSVGLVGGYASGNYSFAACSGASAYGNSSIVIGQEAASSGNGSVALGGGAVASADCAIALGASATASGINAAALGVGSSASGEDSTALGRAVIANGTRSTSIGHFLAAAGYSETVIGSSNIPQSNPSSSWIETENQFVVGNGKGWHQVGTQWVVNKSNAITTLKNGRTTLTNKHWSSSTPAAVPANATEASDGEALAVEGHSALKGNATVDGNTTLQGNATIHGSTVLKGSVTLDQPQGDISMGIYN